MKLPYSIAKIAKEILSETMYAPKRRALPQFKEWDSPAVVSVEGRKTPVLTGAPKEQKDVEKFHMFNKEKHYLLNEINGLFRMITNKYPNSLYINNWRNLLMKTITDVQFDYESMRLR